MMNKKKHPFYQHSDGEFFIAEKDGQIVGKIGVFINTLFNDYHQTKKGQFYFLIRLTIRRWLKASLILRLIIAVSGEWMTW